MDNSEKMIRFLDFLPPQVGREIHAGPWLEIDQERIDRFAEVSASFSR